MKLKTALITGAAKRLGRNLAIHLSTQGYFVFIHYRKSESEAQSCLDQIQSKGGQGSLIKANLSHYSEVSDLAKTIKHRSSSLDLLINNVGEYQTGDLLSFPVKKFESIIQSNLMGSYYTMQTLSPLFPSSGGNIVNIGYTGLNSIMASPQNTAYTISKTGLLILTKSYALSLASKRIRVNMISPGHLENSVDLPSDIPRHFPLNRPGSPSDICQAIDFIISEQSSYITGQNIEVGGGFMMELKSNLN